MSLLSPIEDHDEDVTLLKSHFDPGGPVFPVQVREQDGERSFSTPMVEGLPEHVTQLFLDTFQQDGFPIEATHSFKQLLIDHQHTFATSSPILGFVPSSSMILILGMLIPFVRLQENHRWPHEKLNMRYLTRC